MGSEVRAMVGLTRYPSILVGHILRRSEVLFSIAELSDESDESHLLFCAALKNVSNEALPCKAIIIRAELDMGTRG